MISAVDTNVLLDILIPNADYAAASLETLEKLSGKGSLVISEMVFAELSSQFPSLEELNTFLDDTDIKLVNSNDHALYEASLVWKKYLEDRKKNQKCPHCGEILPGRIHIISELISKLLKSVTPAKVGALKRAENTGFEFSPELQQQTFEIGSYSNNHAFILFKRIWTKIEKSRFYQHICNLK